MFGFTGGGGSVRRAPKPFTEAAGSRAPFSFLLARARGMFLTWGNPPVDAFTLPFFVSGASCSKDNR